MAPEIQDGLRLWQPGNVLDLQGQWRTYQSHHLDPLPADRTGDRHRGKLGVKLFLLLNDWMREWTVVWTGFYGVYAYVEDPLGFADRVLCAGASPLPLDKLSEDSESDEAEIRPEVKIMVGGAPVTERFALDIGADGHAPDAAAAVETAKDLVVLTPSV